MQERTNHFANKTLCRNKFAQKKNLRTNNREPLKKKNLAQQENKTTLFANQNKTKANKTEQNKTEQNKTTCEKIKTIGTKNKKHTPLQKKKTCKKKKLFARKQNTK